MTESFDMTSYRTDEENLGKWQPDETGKGAGVIVDLTCYPSIEVCTCD